MKVWLSQKITLLREPSFLLYLGTRQNRVAFLEERFVLDFINRISQMLRDMKPIKADLLFCVWQTS